LFRKNFSRSGKVSLSSDSTTLSGNDFSITFGKKSGIITSFIYKNAELIKDGKGPRPEFLEGSDG